MSKPLYGLSMLADVTTDHYPVKRRREKRRLNPNWAGIAWLEAQDLADTEIEHIASAENAPELQYMIAHGAHRHYYSRPMFQLMRTDSPSLSARMRPRREGRACPDCDNWAYTTRCTDHPEPPGVYAALSPVEIRARSTRRGQANLFFNPAEPQPAPGWGGPNQAAREALIDLRRTLNAITDQPVQVDFETEGGDRITITYDQQEEQR